MSDNVGWLCSLLTNLARSPPGQCSVERCAISLVAMEKMTYMPGDLSGNFHFREAQCYVAALLLCEALTQEMKKLDDHLL